MFDLCPPAVVYICFSFLQIAINILNKRNELAFVRCMILIVISYIILVLCANNYVGVAWAITFIPYLIMTDYLLMLLIKYVSTLYTNYQIIITLIYTPYSKLY
jgi:hypothetical protein